MQTAAASLQQPVLALMVNSDHEIDAAFAELVRQHAGAVLVGSGGLFVQRTPRVAALAAKHRLPAIYYTAEAAAAGGLMSYGTSIDAAWVQAGVYAGRILKGEKPGELPVVQPNKFELVLNVKTANALGIKFPQTLIARADEVIQ